MSETEQPPEGPYDDAELVIYSASTEYAEDKPQTDWARELGVVSYSLWARYDETEIPIYSRAETGVWLSLDADSYEPDPATPVSDAFVEAIVKMVDEDVGDGWGDPTKETYEAMRDVEKQILGAVQWGFLKMDSAEPALVIDWCQKQYNED